MPPWRSPGRDISGFFDYPIRKDIEGPFSPGLIEGGSWAAVEFLFSDCWIERRVEARDGIEPPNKVLQTLPFSFWVPRPVKKFLPSQEEGNRSIGKKRHIFSSKVTPGNPNKGTFGSLPAGVPPERQPRCRHPPSGKTESDAQGSANLLSSGFIQTSTRL
jgi:hypothetical protein